MAPPPPKDTYDEYDDSWFLGKAKEELKRRQNRPELKKEYGEEDAVQVCETESFHSCFSFCAY